MEKGGAKSWGIGGKKEEMGRREELGGGWQCGRKKQGSREGRMRGWEEGEERIKYWEKGRAGGEAGKSGGHRMRNSLVPCTGGFWPPLCL